MAGFNESSIGHAPQVKSNENPIEEISMENWNKVRSEITKGLDAIDALKNNPEAKEEINQIWNTMGTLLKQLRELEEKLGIKQDFSVSEEEAA